MPYLEIDNYPIFLTNDREQLLIFTNFMMIHQRELLQV